MAQRNAKDTLTRAILSKGCTPEEVTKREDDSGIEARSVSARIRTVADLLAHIDADLDRFEVASSEATKWEGLTADRETGEPVVTELHRVHVRLRPKGGPTTREVVEAMIEAAKKEIRRPKQKKQTAKRDGTLQVVVVSDTHFGKYAWHRTTGGDDYDLGLAERLVGAAGRDLVEAGDSHKPTRRVIAFLGDLFHYDTPSGTTTSGTPLERDGRLQKMIQVGCDSMLGIIERSAETCQTDVVIVNGNHDETLTWAWQRIAVERFRDSRTTNVSGEYRGRQYVRYGGNLLGFAHGHKAKKKLPQIMALEQSVSWSECRYREWHTGHFHSQAAEWQRPTETLDGVVVRTAPALCPPDDWHSTHGFVGSRQCMETFIYDHDGGLVAMHISEPRIKNA